MSPPVLKGLRTCSGSFSALAAGITPKPRIISAVRSTRGALRPIRAVQCSSNELLNSARSADGRLWSVPEDKNHPGQGHTVDRSLLIGKALFIYWPHPREELIPGTGIKLGFRDFNLTPNFGDMKFVR